MAPPTLVPEFVISPVTVYLPLLTSRRDVAVVLLKVELLVTTPPMLKIPPALLLIAPLIAPPLPLTVPVLVRPPLTVPVVVSVPARPDMFTEFDAIQGHRRRYLPGTLRAAFEGSGLALEQVFWWGAWMVPLLGRQRARPRSVPGESTAETYRRYLKLPPGPLAPALRLPFAWDQRRALAHKLRTGTSLFAVARRTP